MIVDTNAISAYADGDKRALRRFAEARIVAIPVIVAGEYRYGIRQSVHRKRYAAWFEELLDSAVSLVVDLPTTHHYAEIRAELKSIGKPIPSNDVWIAALARQHNYPILTRDGHFDHVTGIARFDW